MTDNLKIAINDANFALTTAGARRAVAEHRWRDAVAKFGRDKTDENRAALKTATMKFEEAKAAYSMLWDERARAVDELESARGGGC